MLSVLDDDQYRQLAAVAHSWFVGVLSQVSNEEELERAIALKAKVVRMLARPARYVGNPELPPPASAAPES